MRTDELPAGTDVFIDATIFIYHFTGVSEDCRDLLERCERGEVHGITSVIVVAEVAHRLMTIEAVARKLVAPGNVAKKLREKPALVRKLSTYQEQVQRIPLMGIEIASFDLRLLLSSAELRSQYGLLVNDSMVAAAALDANAGAIASADRDLRRVKSLPFYSPADL